MLKETIESQKETIESQKETIESQKETMSKMESEMIGLARDFCAYYEIKNDEIAIEKLKSHDENVCVSLPAILIQYSDHRFCVIVNIPHLPQIRQMGYNTNLDL